MGQRSEMRSVSLVMNVFIAGSCLVKSEIMTVAVFQRRPNRPTVVLGSMVLSFLVTSCNCLLYVDQDLRLNLVWFIMSRDWE